MWSRLPLHMSNIFVQKYAPTKVEDLILSEDNKIFLSSDFSLAKSPNLLFLGSPGTGKTTLAKILANGYDTLYINASNENGIDTVRSKITDFVRTASIFGDLKVIILDEADGLSSQAQQALRGVIEENINDCRFILTGNYDHKVSDALKSRNKIFYFSLSKKDIAKRLIHIIDKEGIKASKEDVLKLINTYAPDLRKCINELQGNTKNGIFTYVEKINGSIAKKVKDMLDDKLDVFDIRQFVISNESQFSGDYFILMRELYDLYCGDRNGNAVMQCAYHIEKHQSVLDKEINFTSLIFNLSKQH